MIEKDFQFLFTVFIDKMLIERKVSFDVYKFQVRFDQIRGSTR